MTSGLSTERFSATDAEHALPLAQLSVAWPDTTVPQSQAAAQPSSPAPHATAVLDTG